MEVGSKVQVTWEDGKVYDGKVIDLHHTFVKIRYKRFNKNYDEWWDLNKDGKRVMRLDDVQKTSDDLNGSEKKKASRVRKGMNSDTGDATTEDDAERVSNPGDGTSDVAIRCSRSSGLDPLGSGGVAQCSNGMDEVSLPSGSASDGTDGVVHDSFLPSGPGNEKGGVVHDKDSQFGGQKRLLHSDSEEDGSRWEVVENRRKKSRQGSPLLASGTETIEAVGNNTTEVESQRMNRPAGPGPCKFCGVLIVAESVACQGCGCRFHTDVLCLGVGREVVQVLRSNNDGALSYNCNECRLSNSSEQSVDGPYHGVLRQIICTIGEMARLMRAQKQELGRAPVIASTQQNSVSRSIDQLPQKEILQQVRELREREKRAESIVFRGLGDLTIPNVSLKFEAICRELNLPNIQLLGLSKIGTNDMYRARIADKELRRLLLLKASQLKDSQQFARVFINRDLTKQQRLEVVERRRQRFGGRNNVGNSGEDSEERADHFAARANGISVETVRPAQRTGDRSVPQTTFASVAKNGQPRGRGSVAAVRNHFESAMQHTRDIPLRGSQGRGENSRVRGSRGHGRGRGRGSGQNNNVNYGSIPKINF